jgi:SAM-dependent methyltransferase
VFNRIHAWLHPPEKGWDPVPPAYAEQYATSEWSKLDENLVQRLGERIGGFEGKRVLDLGGGPGQFSVAFAKRGAQVTWHDVSRTYLGIAQRHARMAGVAIAFSLGYLEEAERFTEVPFDLVFNRICWYYCMNDSRFARLVVSLVRKGGSGYVDCNPAESQEVHGRRRIPYWLNNAFGLKVGHPFPPHGRIERLIRSANAGPVEADYSTGRNDRVYFVKG